MRLAVPITRQRSSSGNWKTPDLLNGNAGDDKPAEVVRSRFMKLTAALEQEQEANQKRLHDLAVM